MNNSKKPGNIRRWDVYLTDRKSENGSPLVFIVSDIYEEGGIGGPLAELDDPSRISVTWTDLAPGEMAARGWTPIADATLPAYTPSLNVPDEIEATIQSQQDTLRSRMNGISGNRAKDFIGVAIKYSEIITPLFRTALARIHEYPAFADGGIEELLEIDPHVVGSDADLAKKIANLMNAWNDALEAAWIPFKILAMRHSRIDKWPSLRRKSGFSFDRAWHWVFVDGAQWGIRIDTTSGAPQLEQTKPPRGKEASQPRDNKPR